MERATSCVVPARLFGPGPEVHRDAIEPAGAATAWRASQTASTERVSAAVAKEIFSLVYSQMRRLTRQQDVDDLVQIAADKAFRGLRTFEGRAELSTWTFRICYLTLRKHDRWYRRWLRRFALTESGELPDRPTERDTADDALGHRARIERLQAALQRLSTKQRTVLVLYDLEGLSIVEVARVVGATPAAVRSRVRDGRRALGQLLRADPYFGDDACLGKRS